MVLHAIRWQFPVLMSFLGFFFVKFLRMRNVTRIMKLNETKTLNDLASCMEISVNTLKSVLYSRGGVNNKYVQFDIPKKRWWR